MSERMARGDDPGGVFDAVPGRPVEVSESERWFVALDVDGTVMHEDESIDPRVADAVASAVARGHRVTLATGRSWSTTRPVLEHLELDPEYVVCANGAMTMRRDPAAPEGWVQAHVETFDATPVLRQIREALPSGRFLVELADGYRLFTEGMTDWNLERARKVDFEGLLGQPAIRVVAMRGDLAQVVAGAEDRALRGQDHDAQARVRRDLRQRIGQRAEHREGERVARLRPVERQRRDALRGVGAQQQGGAAIGHGYLSADFRTSPISSRMAGSSMVGGTA